MKTLKKTSLLSLICLSFISLCAGLLLLVGSVVPQPPEVHAAGGGGLKPTIFARSVNSGLGINCGELEINGIPWPLDGQTYYEGALADIVYLRALPNPHFELGTGNVFEVFNGNTLVRAVTRAEYNASLPNGIDFNLAANYDYLITVNIVPVQYSVQFSTEYYDKSAGGGNFKTNGNFSIGGISQAGWGTTITFTNTILPTGGKPYGTYVNGRLQDGTGVRFSHAKIKYTAGEETFYEDLLDANGNPLMSFGLGNSLSKYVEGGPIEIIGVYSKVVEVEIKSPLEFSAECITAAAVEPGKLAKFFSGAGIYYFDIATSLTVYASDNQYFEFGGFDINNGIEESALSTYEKILNNNIIIDVKHTVVGYTLYVRGLKVSFDSQGNMVYGDDFDLGDKASFVLNGNAATASTSGNPVKAFDVLSGFQYNGGLDDYRFTGNFLVKTDIGYETFTSINLVSENISTYVNQNGVIVVVAELVEQFSLNVIFNQAETSLGQVKVTFDGTDELVDITKPIDMGREVRIEATPANGYVAFIEIGGIAGQYFTSASKDVAIITMLSDRTVYPRFKSEKFVVSNAKLDFELYYNDNEDLKINNVIYFSYTKEGKIKSWKINGINLSAFGDDVKRHGSTIEITLSAAFLGALSNANSSSVVWDVDKFSVTVDNEVTIAANIGTLLLILIPSVLAVASLGVTSSFMLVNHKRKKLIKAQLVEKRQEKIKRDVGGYISDLREGKGGEITKEDVKQAMKEQKRDKSKDTAVKATTANTMAAASPRPALPPSYTGQQQLAYLLDGGAILTNRTVVSRNKMVIGTLQKDGTLIDAKGSVFATVKFDTGKIFDRSNNLVGVVSGNGTISKP